MPDLQHEFLGFLLVRDLDDGVDLDIVVAGDHGVSAIIGGISAMGSAPQACKFRDPDYQERRRFER